MSTKRVFTAELQRMRQRAGGEAAMSGPAPGNAEVLAAIEGLRSEMRALERFLRPDLPAPEAEDEEAARAAANLERQKAEVNMLKTELRALAVCIEQTKHEIAALRPYDSDEDRLVAVTFELDAIVNSTERATQDILESSEKIDILTGTIQAHIKDTFIRHQTDEIREHVVTIFEACNFQDITGQRITKIVNTLKYVEDRINAMVNIWGADAFVEMTHSLGGGDHHNHKDEEQKLLNGPQLENKGISQSEIDALFG
ncbi:MAG: protein phosphatase CheZ [Alphaproteobacteria bacterium]|nr:protein phosphatase CheZ [Alphaproteobacteria bacterium]